MTLTYRSPDCSISHRPFPVGGPRNQACINGESEAMVDMPLNDFGQGRLFWYQSIPHTTSYKLSIVTFALGRIVLHNTYVTDDRQTDGRNTVV